MPEVCMIVLSVPIPMHFDLNTKTYSKHNMPMAQYCSIWVNWKKQKKCIHKYWREEKR